MLPEAGVVERWKADYLGVWDRAIDGLGPSPAYRAARRATLVRTFDALIADARGGPEMSA
jgi:hypothetical protein